jgi:hypothetical protein
MKVQCCPREDTIQTSKTIWTVADIADELGCHKEFDEKAPGFECSECGIIFTDPAKIRLMLDSVTGEQWAVCIKCGKLLQSAALKLLLFCRRWRRDNRTVFFYYKVLSPAALSYPLFNSFLQRSPMNRALLSLSTSSTLTTFRTSYMKVNRLRYKGWSRD